jgi:hypothetical protein
MNRHLAKEQQLPDMKKEQALASSKAKAVQLRNAAILAERDVDFGKFLQARVEGIEAKFEVSRRSVCTKTGQSLMVIYLHAGIRETA